MEKTKVKFNNLDEIEQYLDVIKNRDGNHMIIGYDRNDLFRMFNGRESAVQVLSIDDEKNLVIKQLSSINNAQTILVVSETSADLKLEIMSAYNHAIREHNPAANCSFVVILNPTLKQQQARLTILYC